MANKSQIEIEVKVGKETLFIDATYYNWVVKEEKKVIAKAPNGNVVTERVVDEGSINVSETKAKKAEITKKWMDENGNIYSKDDLKFFDWEGRQLTENLKTVVFSGSIAMHLVEFLDTYAVDGYYRVDASTEKDQNKVQELRKFLNGENVMIGEFNLVSKGFNCNYAGLRPLADGSFEFMTIKSKKAIQD